jgi:FkbM family methyltransferase
VGGADEASAGNGEIVMQEGITPEHVRWAYRLFLDREPESEEVLLRDAANTTELRNTFMASTEFLLRATTTADKWVITETAHGFRIWVNLSDRFVSLPVLHDRYEPAETALIKSLLRPGDHTIDIGANIGFISLLMASVVGSGGRVLSFEAMPKLRGWFTKSVAENGWTGRISVADCGLSDRDETLWLVYATVTDNFGGAYLSTNATPPPGHSSEPVPVRPLDSVADPHNWRFIKMDVEGAEPLVICGAEQLLRRSRPHILCELYNDQLANVSGTTATAFIQQMRRLRYTCRSLDGQEILAFDGINPVNVLFIPT